MNDHKVYLVYAHEMNAQPPFAIFSDKFEALRFTKRFNEKRDYMLVKRKLNPSCDVQPDLKPVTVCFNANGGVKVYPLNEDSEYLEWALLGIYDIRKRGDSLTCHALVADETAAFVKASRLRDELIAEGLWSYDEQRTNGLPYTQTKAEVNRQAGLLDATKEYDDKPDSSGDGSSVYLVYAADSYSDAPFAIFDDKKKASHFTKRFKNIQRYTTIKHILNPTYYNDLDRRPFGVSFEKRGGLRIYKLNMDHKSMTRALKEKYLIDRGFGDLNCHLLATDNLDALTRAIEIRDKVVARGLWDFDPDENHHRTLADMGFIIDSY